MTVHETLATGVKTKGDDLWAGIRIPPRRTVDAVAAEICERAGVNPDHVRAGQYHGRNRHPYHDLRLEILRGFLNHPQPDRRRMAEWFRIDPTTLLHWIAEAELADA